MRGRIFGGCGAAVEERGAEGGERGAEEEGERGAERVRVAATRIEPQPLEPAGDDPMEIDGANLLPLRGLTAWAFEPSEIMETIASQRKKQTIILNVDGTSPKSLQPVFISTSPKSLPNSENHVPNYV